MQTPRTSYLRGSKDKEICTVKAAVFKLTKTSDFSRKYMDMNNLKRIIF